MYFPSEGRKFTERIFSPGKIEIRMARSSAGYHSRSLTVDVSSVWRQPMKIAYLMEAGLCLYGLPSAPAQNDLMNH